MENVILISERLLFTSVNVSTVTLELTANYLQPLRKSLPLYQQFAQIEILFIVNFMQQTNTALIAIT